MTIVISKKLKPKILIHLKTILNNILINHVNF